MRDGLLSCFQARFLWSYPVQRHLDATDPTSLYIRMGERLAKFLVEAFAVVGHVVPQILLDACTLKLA